MTHGVTTERFDVKVIGFRGENEESDHGQVGPRRFQVVVQSGQSFYEDIGTLVPEFVSTSDEKVQGFVQVEVVVSASTHSMKFGEQRHAQPRRASDTNP